MAKLHFKYGAMNSGKSDTLIKTAYNYEESGLEVATVKPAIDTKGDNFIVARAGHTRPVDILAPETLDLRQAVHDLGKKVLHCVLVDESQFLTREQVGQLFAIAKLDNVSVIAYGLRADFRNDMFPGSKRLFEVADNIEKLPAMCSTKGCGTQAEFNTRKVDGAYTFDGDQVAIDGEGHVEYSSLCGPCYLANGGTI